MNCRETTRNWCSREARHNKRTRSWTGESIEESTQHNHDISVNWRTRNLSWELWTESNLNWTRSWKRAEEHWNRKQERDTLHILRLAYEELRSKIKDHSFQAQNYQLECQQLRDQMDDEAESKTELTRLLSKVPYPIYSIPYTPHNGTQYAILPGECRNRSMACSIRGRRNGESWGDRRGQVSNTYESALSHEFQ